MSDEIKKQSGQSASELDQLLVYNPAAHKSKDDNTASESKPIAEETADERKAREKQERQEKLSAFHNYIASEETTTKKQTATNAKADPINLSTREKKRLEKLKKELADLEQQKLAPELINASDPEKNQIPSSSAAPIADIRKGLEQKDKQGTIELNKAKEAFNTNKNKIISLQAEHRDTQKELTQANAEYNAYHGIFSPHNVKQALNNADPEAQLLVGNERRKYETYKQVFTQKVTDALTQAVIDKKWPKDIIDDSTSPQLNTITTAELNALNALSFLPMSASEMLEEAKLINQYEDPQYYIQLTPAESNVLANINTFSTMDAGELKDFWKDIKDRKAHAEQKNIAVETQLRPLMAQQSTLRDNITQAKQNMPNAPHQAWNQQLTELAKSNPELATLTAAAFKISNHITRLDKEQIKTQLEAASAVNEWREKHIDALSTASELEENLGKVAHAMIETKTHLDTLKQESKTLARELGQLSQSIDQEIAIAEEKIKMQEDSTSWWSRKPEEKAAIQNEKAAIAMLKDVKKQATTDIKRVGSEIDQSTKNVDKARIEINNAYRRSQEPGWTGGVAVEEWKAGNRAAALVYGALTATVVIPLAHAAYTYFKGDNTTSLENEQAGPEKKDVKLLRVNFTDINKKFTEKGVVIEANVSEFTFGLTAGARQELVLKFIGQCLREGLIQDDGKGNLTLEMTSIPGDEMRAYLVAALGQLGIKATGPAMGAVQDELAYKAHVANAQTWMDEEKNRFLIRNPDANKNPDKSSPETMKHWQFGLYVRMMGAAHAAEYVYKKKAAEVEGGIKLAGDDEGKDATLTGGVVIPTSSGSGMSGGVVIPSSSGSGISGGVVIPSTAASGISGGVVVGSTSSMMTNHWKSKIASAAPKVANGNSLFEAVATQLNGAKFDNKTTHNHTDLRAAAVNQMRNNSANFAFLFNGKNAVQQGVYLHEMSRSGKPATEHELKALAAELNIYIQVTNTQDGTAKYYGSAANASNAHINITHDGATNHYAVPTKAVTLAP